MITVVIEDKNIIGLDRIEITDKADINHLKNFFRVKEGEVIRAVDGENEYICKVLVIEKKEIILEIIETKKSEEDEVELIAGISIIKNDKNGACYTKTYRDWN